MLIRIPPPCLIPKREATAKPRNLGRRRFLKTVAVAPAASVVQAEPAAKKRPSLYPATRNDQYKLDRPLSDETIAGQSVIFDEIGSSRSGIAARARTLITSPWTVQIGGAVKKQKRIDVDDLM